MSLTTSAASGGIATRGHNWAWAYVLTVGVVVWLIAAVITAITKDNILVPTVILVGSFLVPVTVITWTMGLPRAGALTPTVIFGGFLAGGTLGVLSSALVETYALPRGAGVYPGVGLIEETAKALVLLGVAHQVRVRGPRDGMVLGAVVGAGFASFESSGYAFSTMLRHVADRPVYNILSTEFSRAILSPFGHILWTSLVGGALFASVSATGRFRVTSKLVWTFLGVVALHAAWDSSYGWAIMLTRGFVGEGWSWAWPSLAEWIGTPTKGDLRFFHLMYNALLIINASIGTWWVVHEYRKHTRLLASGEEHVVELA